MPEINIIVFELEEIMNNSSKGLAVNNFLEDDELKRGNTFNDC